MENEFEYDKYISSLSYVLRSKNRIKVVKSLGERMKIPSDIANEMNLRINQISAILSDLKKKDICVCINEDEKVGRIYQLTPLGIEVNRFLNEMDEK